MHIAEGLSPDLLWKRVFDAVPDFILVLDNQRRLIYCNCAVQESLGEHIDEFLSLSCQASSLGKEEDCLFLEKALLGQNYFKDIFLEGIGRHYQVTASPLLDVQNQVIGCIHIAREITDRRLIEQAVWIKEQAINASINAIAIADPNGILTYVNPAFLQLWGYQDESQLIGKNVLNVWRNEEMTAMVIRTLYQEGHWVSDLATEKVDGTPIDVHITAELVREDDGSPVSMMASFLDISAHQQAERALRESEDRYRQLFAAESDSIFLIDNQTGSILEANAAAEKLYGYSHEELLCLKNSDLSAESEQTRIVTRTSPIDPESVVKIPLRLHKKKDGTIYPVEITGRFFEWMGRSVHIAAIRDITERVKTEQELSESEARYRTIIEQSLQGIIVRKAERIVLVNKAFADMIGYTIHELNGQTIEQTLEWVHPDDRQVFYQRYQDRVAGKRISTRYAYRLIHKQGHILWVDAATNTIVYEGEQAQLGMYLDISEQKQIEEALKESQRALQAQLEKIQLLQDQLREQAIRDPLTGLYNRRYMEETLDREIAQAKRSNTPIGIVLLDLDHFKIFNDTHGHQNGDLVLQELGKLLEKQFRSGDIACRYGGEEFLVIMPGTTLKDACQRADEVRILFAKIPFQTVVQRQSHVTLSAGVSVYPDHGLDSEEIINCADQALYMAKNSGRNRVSIFLG